MVLLAAEQHLTAAELAEIVRASEETVRRWLKRYLAEGIEGLRDAPHVRVLHARLPQSIASG
jgi:DNA-directed RNA polymerase specialized sigma24 family protein